MSPDVWCVPTKNIRSFVEELRGVEDVKPAQRVLKNYCHLLGSKDPACMAKVAAGLAELADLYAAPDMGLLEFAMAWVGESLSKAAAEAGKDLSFSFACLIEQAELSGNYAAIDRALLQLERGNTGSGSSLSAVKKAIQLDDRAEALVGKALELSDPELMNVLRRIPEAAAEQAALRFSQAATREQCERLRRLALELGPAAREHWQRLLLSGSDAQAAEVIGILTAIASDFVEQALPVRLRHWSCYDQSLAVQQMAASGAPDRGGLLMRLLADFQPLVVPQVLDEVGMAGCPQEIGTALLHMVRGEASAFGEPYVQLKAIEAVGRLRWASAVPELKELVSAKSFWKAVYPRETRIVALQALSRIDRKLGSAWIDNSGISVQELRLAPLPAGNEGWVRHRRYPRVAVAADWRASVSTGRESFPLELEMMSLGGGLGSAPASAQYAGEAALEIRSGLRSVRLQALVRQQSPSKMMFEIASISMEHRSRLRGLLTAQS